MVGGWSGSAGSSSTVHFLRRPRAAGGTAPWAEARAVYHLADDDRSADTGGARRGAWRFTGTLPEPWHVSVPLVTAAGAATTLVLEVHPAPSGQVGVFIEQIDQWRWLARTTPAGSAVLSLFGHSGAATLAAATAGAEVVHVDASRQAIALARRNAEASGLAHLPVSWVCEDAATFVARAIRRGRRFSGVVLDPPSWGHGPKGQAFAIDRDLPNLLADLARLLDAGGARARPAHMPLARLASTPAARHTLDGVRRGRDAGSRPDRKRHARLHRRLRPPARPRRASPASRPSP